MNNIEIKQYDAKYNKAIYDLFCEVRDEDDFFLKFDYEGFCSHLFNHRGFKAEGSFIALDGEKLVGFASGCIRDADNGNEKASGYIHTIFVKKEYRFQGIGKAMLLQIEDYVKAAGRTSIRSVFLSPINWPWYIPYTDHHMHPGMPCVRINSDFYIFLYHMGYAVNSMHEGFHLPLAQYEFPEKVKAKMEENAKIGLTVEIYDPAKHFGIDEFCKDIEAAGLDGFAHSIRYNLYEREKPLPFVVAADHGKVVGWTGAMYVESTGRGHLDGICVHPDYRQHGLGKCVFSMLCKSLKEMGASYMTFFTGLDNPARYIYMGAGFRVAQSFADMKKNL